MISEVTVSLIFIFGIILLNTKVKIICDIIAGFAILLLLKDAWDFSISFECRMPKFGTPF
jgi:hypothetical protein